MNEALCIRVRCQFEDSASGLDLDCSLPLRGTVGIFGPSGAGKTTLLRILAGLNQVSSETQIRFGDQIWQDETTFMPAFERRIGYVPQAPSLFPHLSVRDNIRYGASRSNMQFDLSNVIEVLEIEHLMDRSVHHLSGGEQQRVALARALAPMPQLLLLDEPLSALDATRKQEILPMLTRIKSEFGIPMLYVTHSSEELAQLADHLLLLANGRLKASGPVAELFPTLSGVSDAGVAVLLKGKVSGTLPEWRLATFAFAGGELLIPDSGLETGTELRVRVQARDVSITLQAESQTSILNRMPATVTSLVPGPDPAMLLVAVNVQKGQDCSEVLCQLTKKSASDLELAPGAAVHIQIKSVAILG